MQQQPSPSRRERIRQSTPTSVDYDESESNEEYYADDDSTKSDDAAFWTAIISVIALLAAGAYYVLQAQPYNDWWLYLAYAVGAALDAIWFGWGIALLVRRQTSAGLLVLASAAAVPMLLFGGNLFATLTKLHSLRVENYAASD